MAIVTVAALAWFLCQCSGSTHGGADDEGYLDAPMGDSRDIHADAPDEATILEAIAEVAPVDVPAEGLGDTSCGAPVPVNPNPYLSALQEGPVDACGAFLATELRWIDFLRATEGSEQVSRLLAATGEGIFVSDVGSDGGPLAFAKVTSAPVEYARFVRSREGRAYALCSVEQVGEAWFLRVYELSRLVEEHAIVGTPTAAWSGDLLGASRVDGGATDVVVGTDASASGLQIFKGCEGSDGDLPACWFEAGSTTLPGVAGVETIAVGDMDGDGLADLTAGPAGGAGGVGFVQALQTTPGGFGWPQVHVPTSGAPGFKAAGLAGLALAELIDEQEGLPRVPEIVAVGRDSDNVTVLRRVLQGAPIAQSYEAVETTFADGASPFGPTFLVGSRPTFVVVADVGQDALPDLVVVDEGSENVVVAPSYVVGSAFQLATSNATYYHVGPQPYRAWAFDLGGRGCPDLLVAHRGSGAYSRLRNPFCDERLLVASIDVPAAVDPADPSRRLVPLRFAVADVDLKPEAFDDAVVVTERIDVTVDVDPSTGQPILEKRLPLWLYRSRGAYGAGVAPNPIDAGSVPAEYAGVLTDFALGNVAKTDHPEAILTFRTPAAPPPLAAGEPVAAPEGLAVLAYETTGMPHSFVPLTQPVFLPPRDSCLRRSNRHCAGESLLSDSSGTDRFRAVPRRGGRAGNRRVPEADPHVVPDEPGHRWRSVDPPRYQGSRRRPRRRHPGLVRQP